MKGDTTQQRRWEAYDKLGTFVIYALSFVLAIQAIGLEGEGLQGHLVWRREVSRVFGVCAAGMGQPAQPFHKQNHMTE